MKNQSFHQRKIRIQETPELDFDQLKARTINALSKLGQQKFSTETGGYALDNWVRGVNVLLDEFEEKAGVARLSPEYLTSRNELNERLSRPVQVSSIDEDMSQLNTNISDIESKIEAGRALVVSRISELKAARASYSGELERERRRVAEAPAAQNTNSLFNRLLGKNKTPTKDPENIIRELESKLAILPDEILEQQKQLSVINAHSPESRFAQEWNQLELMQTRLRQLEEERSDRIQLVKERAEMTGSIADAISRIL
ncbi:MAG TPA: hypothetical protein VED22_03475 [Nitrososphaerales archaeon]|nr:hypothetical protein [Nitrososphaerales archaeon]